MKTLSLTSFIIIAFALLGTTAAAQQRPRVLRKSLDSIDHRVRMLTEVLEPGLLGTGVMLGGLNQIHESHDRLLEALAE